MICEHNIIRGSAQMHRTNESRRALVTTQKVGYALKQIALQKMEAEIDIQRGKHKVIWIFW
jgi:hypothetical protein